MLADFRINSSRLGYFVLNNAYNNDTAVAALANKFNFNPEDHRLRCLGYILNLVVKQLIFGATANAVETKDDSDFDFNNVSDKLKR